MKNPPSPPFTKGGNNQLVSGKSPFIKGGFREIIKDASL